MALVALTKPKKDKIHNEFIEILC